MTEREGTVIIIPLFKEVKLETYKGKGALPK